MTFGEQVLATLVGSIAGFLFAIALFYLREKITGKRVKKNIAKCLKREFQYNLNLIEEWIQTVDRILQKITVQDYKIFDYLRYSSYQRFYLYQSFQFGVLYDFFNNEDVKIISDIENHLNINVEQYINFFIDRWKREDIGQREIHSAFDFQKQSLQREKRQLEGLFVKLK